MPRIPAATVRAINQLDRPEGIDAMFGTPTLALDYDVYEIAYLAGGPCRAVDAAVVALAGGGHLTVDHSTGHLTAAGVTRHHWLEAAVSDGVGRRDWRTVRTLRRRLELDGRFAGVARRLGSDGLLRRSASGSHRRRTWQLLALTGKGRRTLRSLRAQPPFDRFPAGTDVMAVALGGPAAMTDTALRRALFHPPAPGPVPGDRRSRREIRDARLGMSTPVAGATFWFAGSENSSWSGYSGDGGVAVSVATAVVVAVVTAGAAEPDIRTAEPPRSPTVGVLCCCLEHNAAAGVFCGKVGAAPAGSGGGAGRSGCCARAPDRGGP